jgi:predicted PurR-regulated permease PerM
MMSREAGVREVRSVGSIAHVSPGEGDRPGARGLSKGDQLSVMVAGLFALACLYSLYAARAVLFPLCFSIILSFVLNPIVKALKRLSIPESVGAALAIVLLLGAVAAGIYMLSGPAAAWIARTPDGIERIETRARKILKPVQTVSKTADQVEQITKGGGREEIRVQGPGLGQALFGGVQDCAACVALMAPLVYLLLASGDLFLRKIVRLLPRLRDKRRAVEIARESQKQISAYLLTTTLLNVALGLGVTLLMLAIGMPNPLLWGVLAAVLNYVPVLGALVCALILTIAGVLAFDEPTRALLPPLMYLALQGLEGNLVKPMTLGRSLALDPVVLFVGVIFWSWIWGIPGGLLAVPMMSTFKIFCDRTDTLAPFGEFLGQASTS